MISFFCIAKPVYMNSMIIYQYFRTLSVLRCTELYYNYWTNMVFYHSFESSIHFPLLFFPQRMQFEKHFYYYYWSIVLIFCKWFNISSNFVHWLRCLNRRRIVFFTYNRWSGYHFGNSFTLNQPLIIRVMSTTADTWNYNFIFVKWLKIRY